MSTAGTRQLPEQIFLHELRTELERGVIRRKPSDLIAKTPVFLGQRSDFIAQQAADFGGETFDFARVLLPQRRPLDVIFLRSLDRVALQLRDALSHVVVRRIGAL